MTSLAKILGRLLLILTLAAMSAAAAFVIVQNRQITQYREDLAELQNAKYQLVDASAWVTQVRGIVETSVDAFELTPLHREQLKRILAPLLVEVTEIIQQDALDNIDADLDAVKGDFDNGESLKKLDLGTLWKNLEILGNTSKNAAAVLIVKAIDMTPDRADRYARAIIARAEQDDIQSEIKSLVKQAIAGWAETTRGNVDRAPFQAILTRHACTSGQACQALLTRRIAVEQRPVHLAAAIVIAGLAALLVVAGLSVRVGQRAAWRWPLIAAVVGSLPALAAGVAASLASIEARVQEYTVTFLSIPITFTDQLLYYRNKSILDVISDLIANSDPILIMVGIGILAFSIIVPLGKLIATALAAMMGREPWLVAFFARDTAKWAMADVFVVAILLAYFGIDGIVGQQMAWLDQRETVGNIVSTGGSSLDVGFPLFLAFAISGLILSEILKRAKPRP